MHGSATNPPHVKDRSASAGFALNPLNRMSMRRQDAAFLEQMSRSETARTLVFSEDLPIVKRGPGGFDPFFTLAEAAELGKIQETAFLGCDEELALFASLIERSEDAPAGEKIAFIDIRLIATQGLLPAEVVGPLGEAKSLLSWHVRHRFCSNCGAPTRSLAGGWRRGCDRCGAQHFPRTDPAVIMLIVDGEDCLLGRQAAFAPKMYSCLAGFMESGETIEDAVRREVAEEAGIAVGRVDYLASQPWPFPSSLMIGCIGEALGRDLSLDDKELEDARWFRRDEVRRMLERTHPSGLTCPSKVAIANLLLTAWAYDDIPFEIRGAASL
ncbi:NAD(+) diphosphatase [Methylocella tundrae]|uniref:NAD(+) diphosphatase n=1 Tax=Methylocella tundrae TaxID=227605 RepID=A0A4U8YVG3_METTU|nr:NAD(+) diphosphatase [Methylocella tundrae]WPP05008.1 NAD(+) diphosphatase [Methylocella tundrae]VFU07303.1 NUDIX hydrolase [Methylocella tundrae]